MPTSTKALLIVPANNTTMEPEIAALCPELGTILVAVKADAPTNCAPRL